MWREIFYIGQVFCECLWLTRILLKPGLKKLNPTVCCHLNLRDAGKLPTLRIFLRWPVKMPIISPFEIHSFQPAEAVSQQRHGRGNTWTHAQTWESLMCLNAGQRKTSLPPCEDFQSQNCSVSPFRVELKWYQFNHLALFQPISLQCKKGIF